MRLDKLETHDRFIHFIKEEFNIGKSVQTMIDKKPFGDYPFYIFAHKREIGLDERIALFNQDLQNLQRQFLSLEDVPCNRIIWQPRLMKPEAVENSMLFKGYPGTDLIKTIWIIPQRELWEQYEKGKMLENKTICDSIYAYKNHRKKLEYREDDDVTEELARVIYHEMYGPKDYIRI